MPGFTFDTRWIRAASDMEDVRQMRSPNVATAHRMTSSVGAPSSAAAADSTMS